MKRKVKESRRSLGADYRVREKAENGEGRLSAVACGLFNVEAREYEGRIMREGGWFLDETMRNTGGVSVFQRCLSKSRVEGENLEELPLKYLCLKVRREVGRLLRLTSPYWGGSVVSRWV
jgi:hypothetical protein